jgi:seryl-tRNA synthetase
MDQNKLRQILESSIYAWKKKEPGLDLSKYPLTNERYFELKEKLLKEFGDEALHIKRKSLEKDIRELILRKKFEEKIINNQIKSKDRYFEQRLMFSISKLRHDLESLNQKLEEISKELDEA